MNFVSPLADPAILIRPLTAGDTEAYRALRQRVLQIGDGRYFGDSYMRENQLKTAHAWAEWCTEKLDHCIFGTFIGSTLIGVMMITHYHGFGDRTVEWEAIWLEPQYRRRGLARLAYDYLRRWTQGRGFNRVVLFIRADNVRSLHVHRKLGARYVITKRDEVWADGGIADVHTFLLDLDAHQIDIARPLVETISFPKDQRPPRQESRNQLARA